MSPLEQDGTGVIHRTHISATIAGASPVAAARLPAMMIIMTPISEAGRTRAS
jgi:hypothetical protein